MAACAAVAMDANVDADVDASMLPAQNEASTR